jgi:adenylate cyclase
MYLGKMYIQEGQMDSAYYYLSKTLKNYGAKLNSYHARPLAILSEYFLAEQNLDSAEYCALKSLELSLEQNEYISPLISTQSLSTVYYQKKDFEKAHNYLRAHNSLQNIDFQDGARQKITEMQTIFEFKKKIREDEIRHEEEIQKKNRLRNLILTVSVFVLVLAGGLWSRLNYVRRSKTELQQEKNISENLLLNILPAEIALELKTKGKADAQSFELASILFTDFKDFTEFSSKLNASDLVKEINHCFEAFDEIIEKYGIEKIKTIGDSYMAAGGLPIPTENSVKNTLLAAIELQEFIEKRKMKLQALGQAAFEMRVGIHTGPVVAGIVGLKKFQYDIWGDTVNTASRMESCGAVGKVNISEATFQLLKNDPNFKFEPRGEVAAKGKGKMTMYFAYKAL